MKTKNMKIMMIVGISIVLMVAGVACSPTSAAVSEKTIEEPMAQDTVVSVDEPAAVVAVPASNETAAIEVASAYTGVLSDAEVAGLLFMREEEKLAGDVYRYFYSMYGSPVFQNISTSEDTHTESVLALLNQYGIADPAVSEAGVFTNPDLQALYDQLIARGSQSLQDALLVGAAIEEIDILDLEERIAQTDKADIQLVYQNLLQGSENHLRAFVRLMGNQSGQAYTPQYIPQDRYDQIMEGANGAGASGNVGKGGGRRWN